MRYLGKILRLKRGYLYTTALQLCSFLYEDSLEHLMLYLHIYTDPSMSILFTPTLEETASETLIVMRVEMNQSFRISGRTEQAIVSRQCILPSRIIVESHGYFA